MLESRARWSCSRERAASRSSLVLSARSSGFMGCVGAGGGGGRGGAASGARSREAGAGARSTCSIASRSRRAMAAGVAWGRGSSWPGAPISAISTPPTGNLASRAQLVFSAAGERGSGPTGAKGTTDGSYQPGPGNGRRFHIIKDGRNLLSQRGKQQNASIRIGKYVPDALSTVANPVGTRTPFAHIASLTKEAAELSGVRYVMDVADSLHVSNCMFGC